MKDSVTPDVNSRWASEWLGGGPEPNTSLDNARNCRFRGLGELFTREPLKFFAVALAAAQIYLYKINTELLFIGALLSLFPLVNKDRQ